MVRMMKMVSVVAIVGLALVVAGCENPASSDDEEGGGEAGNANFSATVDGEDWSAANASVTFSQASDYLSIKGNNPEAEIDIGVSVPKDIAPGTYDLTSSTVGEPQAVLYPASTSIGTHFPDPAGTLVIEHHDTDNYDIKGTFAFTAARTGDSQEYSVENGQFDFDGEYYSQ